MAWHYDKDKITYFAETDFRGQRVKFGIREEDRARHMYIIGKTGMGKSTLLENLAVQDIINGEGLCFIDPHGGSAELLLRYVPEHRIKDVVYFAPHEMDFPIALNVLENDDPNKRPLIASGILSTFKKVWPDAWSGRMEYFLMNTLLALLETPGSTLLGVNRMYSDKDYREKVIANITDTSVRAFWVDEYANMTEKMVAEATPAIQNKVGQFSMNPIMRNVLGQSESTFDIRKLMDERKIFIVNLSKGRMGETNAALLGALLVTKIYLAAMSRADLNEGDLKVAAPFHLYVDEFQNFANESFANILSEARKYKLALTIAHQYIEQMPEEVRDAVFGNVGTMITYRVGAADAEVLEKEFTPTFTMDDIVGLGFAQIYLKLMINGAASTAFSARTSDKPPAPEKNFEAEVRAASREQFGRPREDVEEVIKEWFTSDKSKGGDDGRPGAKKFAPGQRPAFGAASGGSSYSAGPRTGGGSPSGSGFERRGDTRPASPPPQVGQKAEGVSLREALGAAGLANKGAPVVVVPVPAVEAPASAAAEVSALAPAHTAQAPIASSAVIVTESAPVAAKPLIAPIARQIERAALRPAAAAISASRIPLRAPVPVRPQVEISARVSSAAPARVVARASLEEEDKDVEEELLPPSVVERTPQNSQSVQASRVATQRSVPSAPNLQGRAAPQVQRMSAAQRTPLAEPVQPMSQPMPQQFQQAPAQPPLSQQYPPQPQMAPQYQPQYAPQYQQQYPPQYQPQYSQPQYGAPLPIYPQYAYPPQQQYGQYGYAPFYHAPLPPQQQYYQTPLQAPSPQQYTPQPMYQPQPPIYQPYPPMIHYSEPPMPTAGMMSPPHANPIPPVAHIAPASPAVISSTPSEPQVVDEEKENREKDSGMRMQESKQEKGQGQRQESKQIPREVRKEESRGERKDVRRDAPKTLVRENDGKGPSDEKLDALSAALAKLNANFSAPSVAATPVVETKSEVKEVPLDVLKKVLES